MKQNLLLFSALLLSSCSNNDQVIASSNPGDKLLGTWTGTHMRDDGIKKEWKQIRSNDGTYNIHFIYTNKYGKTLNKSETGKWWATNTTYNEINPSIMSQSDSYKYTFYENNCIEFTSVKRDASGDEKAGYSFTECKIQK